MIDVVRAVIDRAFGPVGESLNVLVLGDPSARMCGALTEDGHQVSCCPDLQTWGDPQHSTVVAPTLEGLHSLDDHWDLVVAVEGFRRMQEVHRPDRLESFFEWLSRHCQVLVVEAPRRPLAPDLHDLGPYSVFELLGSFLAITEVDESVSEVSEPERPVLVASNHGFLLDGTWTSSTRAIPLIEEAEVKRRRVRTFDVDDRVVKIELASEGYFDRCEALMEAHFLSSVSERERRELHLPTVSEMRVGRAVNLTVRDFVIGQTFAPGSCATDLVRLTRVIDEATRWADLGLFHNDLRPWNLLDDGDRVALIDYAVVSRMDSDVQGLPQIVALAATLVALTTDELPWGEGFLPAVESLVTEIGIDEGWTPEYLVGDHAERSPWISLPLARDRLCASLSNVGSRRIGDLLTQLIGILASAGTTRIDTAHG